MADQPKKQSGGSDRRSHKSAGATAEASNRKRTLSTIETETESQQERLYQESASDHQEEQSTRSRKRSKKSKKKRKDSEKKSSKGAPKAVKPPQETVTAPKPVQGRRRSSTQSNPDYKEPKKSSPTTRFAIQPIGEGRLRSKSPSRRKSLEYTGRTALDLRVRTVSGASCSSVGSFNQSIASEELEASTNRRLSLRSNPSCTVIPGLPYYPEPSPRNKSKSKERKTPSSPKPESGVPQTSKDKPKKQRKSRKKSQSKLSSTAGASESSSNIPVESLSTLVGSTAPPVEVFSLPTSGCLLPKKRARLSVEAPTASTSVPSSTETTKTNRKGSKSGDSKKRGKKKKVPTATLR